MHGPEYEKEKKQKWMLQQEVLAHLKEHGPRKWEMLYVHFDQKRTSDVAPALQDLQAWEYIEVGKDNNRMVTITASGLKRLEEKAYREGHGRR